MPNPNSLLAGCLCRRHDWLAVRPHHMRRDAGTNYLVKINLPLLVIRKRYSAPACSMISSGLPSSRTSMERRWGAELAPGRRAPAGRVVRSRGPSPIRVIRNACALLNRGGAGAGHIVPDRRELSAPRIPMENDNYYYSNVNRNGCYLTKRPCVTRQTWSCAAKRPLPGRREPASSVIYREYRIGTPGPCTPRCVTRAIAR